MRDFARYLDAKRRVDDRSLNRPVWERLVRELRDSAHDPVAVADIGAGIGTGAERMRDWGLVEPIDRLRVTLVEPEHELLERAKRRHESLPFRVEYVRETLEELAGMGGNHGRFDLVVAHALLDVLDLSMSLDALGKLVRDGGLLYLPITFDGETIFEPAHADDGAILSAYHRTMEGPGSSRTGRRLFHELRARSFGVLEIGSSDWIVHPSEAGGYPADEAFFLRFLLGTIEGAVRESVEAARLDSWRAERRRQIDESELFFCAHQIDVLARKRR